MSGGEPLNIPKTMVIEQGKMINGPELFWFGSGDGTYFQGTAVVVHCRLYWLKIIADPWVYQL